MGAAHGLAFVVYVSLLVLFRSSLQSVVLDNFTCISSGQMLYLKALLLHRPPTSSRSDAIAIR